MDRHYFTAWQKREVLAQMTKYYNTHPFHAHTASLHCSGFGNKRRKRKKEERKRKENEERNNNLYKKLERRKGKQIILSFHLKIFFLLKK